MSRDYKHSPVIDGLGLVSPREAPAWVTAVVQDKSGRKRIALGVLEPGLLTKAQALELAMQLQLLATPLGHEADDPLSHQAAPSVGGLTAAPPWAKASR